MELKGKVAVITGGAIRVGRALTLALAQAGCHVFIHYGSSASSAKQTRTDVQKLGIEADIYSANLLDVTETQNIIPAAVERFGQVDILINSAAIFPEKDSFTTTDLTLWDKLLAVNLRAPFLLSRAFAAQVPERGQGKIINILDARVRRPALDHFVYRLTKGGLWTMTEMLAQELAPRITVNAVALGAILPPPGADASYLDKLAREKVPLKRAGSAEIMAENVLHLLRQDFLTGAIIPIDGGQFL
jgi:NAD(P)-dependent dehydrogenase (short-subunit alcohol dehydrogenase family)